jgi:hypothetical protein
VLVRHLLRRPSEPGFLAEIRRDYPGWFPELPGRYQRPADHASLPGSCCPHRLGSRLVRSWALGPPMRSGLRVEQTGVRFLFAFLLTAPLQSGFGRLDHWAGRC